VTVSRTAREVGVALRADGRRRALVDRLRQLLYTIEPQVATSPHKRRRLREVIDELAGAGAISLPKGRAQYDQVEQPPLPRFVVVEGLAEPASRRAAGAETHPWLRELRWAASLRPPLRVDEMDALLKVSAFLTARRGREVPVVPLQERSLAIFGEEKRLAEMAGQRLFAPGRLSFPLLACREVHPPFVHVRLSDLPTMLVVENSATYDTLRRVLDASGPIGCLAYGAGKHFIGSVSAARELVPVPRRILYFGDVDADGLMIPTKACDTAAAHDLPAIEPASVLYDLLFGFAPEPEGGGRSGAVEDARVSWLPARWQDRAADLLGRSRRLAQEHVGLEVLQADGRWVEELRSQLAGPAGGIRST
jgi:hypothetical protein